jgi:pimeloyl-ACP methyl ester carboxylesterase
MPSFDSDGLEIAYVDEGEGDPILLIHGFASNMEVNWIGTGWVQTLTRAGRRVVAFDNRGHGKSDKVYDPGFYTIAAMAGDASRLLDHLGIARADVMGYSMGARIGAVLALQEPERVRSLVLGGVAENLMGVTGQSEQIAAALEAPSAADVMGPMPLMFRTFAERTGGDLKALAACMRSPRTVLTPADLARLTMPVLLAVGSADEVAGSPGRMAELLPSGKVLIIQGRDHNRAVGDKVFKEGVLAFLADRP